jgi:hypothetical protein
VPHVAEVRANVRAKKRGVIVNLDLQVDPEANLATVTDEACATAESVLTDRVHVALVQPPTARLHYRELRLQGRGNGNGRRSNRVPLPIEAPPDHYLRTPATATAAAGAAVPPAAVAVAAPPEPPELPESLARRGEDEADDLAAEDGVETADAPEEEKAT